MLRDLERMRPWDAIAGYADPAPSPAQPCTVPTTENVFRALSQINDWKKDHTWKNQEEAKAAAYVVQKYIHNPQLIGGKKFDLRLYVLVTSYAPLTVYMYRSGFARFSSYRYNTNAKNLGDTYVHLTNVAVQKTGPGFDAGAGSKWPLRAYRLFLVGKYGHQ